jgi:ATP-binding cassette, subfamily B, bacterial
VDQVEPAKRFERARRAVLLIWSMVRLHPRVFLAAVSGAAVFALCTVASSYAVQWVIDEVILPRFEEGSVATGTVVTGCALIIGIGVVRAAGVVVRRSFAGMTQWRVAGTLTDGVIDRLVAQPASWHHRRPDGDLVARAGVDADAAVSVLAPIPFATGTVLMVVVAAIWMISIDVVMGCVAVLLFPVLIAMNIVYQHRVDRFYDSAQQHLGALSAGVHESFEGVQLVKAYGAEHRETERLSSMADDVRTSRVQAVRLRGTFEAALEIVPSLTNVALVWLGAYRVSTGDLTVGQLSSVVFMFTLLVFPLRLIGFALSELPHSMAGWLRVRTVLDEPVEPDPAAGIAPAAPGVGVSLTDVDYTFEGEQEPTLEEIRLDVPVGRIVAVVGPTGAGKTTLVELVAGLIAPTRGIVRLAEGERTIVFQEAFLFSGTVRDNIEVGTAFPEPQLWEALRLAAAEHFVRDLPHGLDTVVGERGVSLSGGQRQRIALARALVRRPALLLLDDTTSALDPATESKVLGSLRTALAGTTVLLVASRPSTIALADEVAYLAGGRVVAHGSHTDLMRTERGYRMLVEAFEHDRDSVPPAADEYEEYEDFEQVPS